MKRADLVLGLCALPMGLFVAVSADRWLAAAERAPLEIAEAKRELLASAGLDRLHHKVYAAVGEQAWEADVKPAFMSAITWETVRETGDPLPGWRDIVKWARAHPQRARELLEAAATRRER